MNRNRGEERDEAPAGAERRDADDEQPATRGRDSAEGEARTNGGRGPSDPDLAIMAERAEPSSDAKRLDYDPAAEDV